MGTDDIGIGAGEADGIDAYGLQSSHDILVDQSAIDHRDHFEHGCVGDASAAHHSRLDAQRLCHLGSATPAAMH